MRPSSLLPFALLLSVLVTPAFRPPPPSGGATPPADASVAFRKDGRLCLARADGSGQTVVSNLSIDGSIAWAPNGGPILFEATGGIYRINANGTGQTRIVPLANTYHYGISVTRGAPCPDGQARVFYTDGVGDSRDLYCARLDGTDRIRLTTNPSGEYYNHVSVSPAGDKVLVMGFDLRLLTLGVVGGQLAVIADQSLIADDPNHPMNPWVSDWFFFSPWFEDLSADNPSGLRVLFAARHEVDFVTVSQGIYRMDVSVPSSVNMLPIIQQRPGSASTTPNGQQIYFQSSNSSNRGTIYRGGADGSGATMWINPGTRGDHRMPCTKP